METYGSSLTLSQIDIDENLTNDRFAILLDFPKCYYFIITISLLVEMKKKNIDPTFFEKKSINDMYSDV